MASQLDEQGFRIVIIGASGGEPAEQAAAAFAQHVDVLTDPNRAVYQQYGFSKMALVLQRSGVIVVDRHGVVRYTHRTTNPKKSLDREQLLNALRELT